MPHDAPTPFDLSPRFESALGSPAGCAGSKSQGRPRVRNLSPELSNIALKLESASVATGNTDHVLGLLDEELLLLDRVSTCGLDLCIYKRSDK